MLLRKLFNGPLALQSPFRLMEQSSQCSSASIGMRERHIGCRRLVMAIRRALFFSSCGIVSLIAHPITRRENKSSTIAG